MHVITRIFSTSKKMKEALGTSLLSNASLHWSNIKNAAATPENPLCGFCKPARSVRRPWMTDEQIREALAVHCRNTRPATAQPQDKLALLRLQGSLARAMKNTPKISKVYAESTIYHRVRIHSPKPGVMKERPRKKWTSVMIARPGIRLPRWPSFPSLLTQWMN